MTTGRINQGASSCFVNSTIKLRAHARDSSKASLTSNPSTRAAVSNVDTLVKRRTDDTLRMRIASESSIVHAMVRSNKKERTTGTFEQNIYRGSDHLLKRDTIDLGARYATTAQRSKRHRGNYRSNSNRLSKRENIPDVRLKSILSSWSTKRIRRT